MAHYYQTEASQRSQETTTGTSRGTDKFYRDLAAGSRKLRVGMESGQGRWFERLPAELKLELSQGRFSRHAYIPLATKSVDFLQAPFNLERVV